MNKSEKTGSTYQPEHNCHLPDLTVPETIAAQYMGSMAFATHQSTIQYHYTALLLSGKPGSYLVKINQQAWEIYFRLVAQIAECKGITEQHKAENWIEWSGQMNHIQN